MSRSSTTHRHLPSFLVGVLVAIALVTVLSPASSRRLEAAPPIGRADLLINSGIKQTNGATPVVIFAGVANTQLLLAGATLWNVDSIVHTVTITSNGVVLREFPLAPAASFGTAVFDEGNNIQAGSGLDLSYYCDIAGISTAIRCTASADRF